MNGIRIPVIKNFEQAIKIYYSLYELGTGDIKLLFGVGAERARRLKKHAKAYATENGVTEINASTVDTEAAFKSWGLDIKSIEARHQRLKKLGLEQLKS